MAMKELKSVTEDPVCGMIVDKATAFRAERDGHAFYFCSDHCRKMFLSTPAIAEHDDKPLGKVIYTCPMHPEVQQNHPGDCPKCGMALELQTVSAVEEENHELTDMTRRFWMGAALALPVFLLAMAHMIPSLGHERWIMGNPSRWIQFVLSTPVVLWAGWPFFKRGWHSLATRHLNMFTLIAIGVGTAYLFSAVVMFVPDAFPASFAPDGKVGIYFEAAAVIVVLVLLGQVLELRARSKTGSAIRALLNLAPKTARVFKTMTNATCRSDPFKPEQSCACVPEKQFRWTALCSTGKRRWTSP
jgi:Cu+-exporting ATPase